MSAGNLATSEAARSLGQVVLLMACLLLAGCPARWGAVVKNTTDAPIKVTMGDAVIDKIPPGKTGRVPFSTTVTDDYKEREIVVSWPSGEKQLQAKAFSIWKEAMQNGATYPNIYVIVSADRIRAATDQVKGE